MRLFLFSVKGRGGNDKGKTQNYLCPGEKGKAALWQSLKKEGGKKPTQKPILRIKQMSQEKIEGYAPKARASD